MIMIGALASFGLLISLYFVLVYHGILEPDSRFVPSLCRMNKESCLSIIHTPDARLFGIPNFHLGVLYYLVLIALVFFQDLLIENSTAVRILSGGTVVVGAYLTYSLLFKLKTHCVLCYGSHVVNFFLFMFLLVFP